MNSSTSNSKAGAAARLGPSRIYGLSVVLVFLLFFCAFQFAMPALMPELRGGRADFVLKLLGDSRRNLVVGDSHVGQRDRMGDDYLFLGRPGGTTFELLQALETYFRNKDPGRIMLEVGPQLFVADRQTTWRTFNKDSFKFQRLPIPLYVFEPELVAASPAIFGLDGLLRYRYRLRSHERRLPKAVAAARSWGKELDKVHWRLTTVEEIPLEARRTLATYRFATQLPVAHYRESAAWGYFVELLDFLKARGAEVCLLRMPISPLYREIVEASPSGAHYKASVADLRAEAKARGMRFFDYKDLLPDLPAGYFKNQDHLNDLGHRIFWPAAEDACFGAAAPTRPARRLYHVFTLRNAGFEAKLLSDDGSGPHCPPGWLWRSPLPPDSLRRYRDAVADSPFGSRHAYGVANDAAGPGVGQWRWWSLGKRFRSEGGTSVEISLKVRSDGLVPARDDPTPRDGRVAIGDDDAYIEVSALDRDGNAIPLRDDARFSPPLSRQALRSKAQGPVQPPWYVLSHRFTLPSEGRQFRIWLTAVSGRGEPRPLGWKGGAPQILFDDLEVLSDGEIEEVQVGKQWPVCGVSGAR